MTDCNPTDVEGCANRDLIMKSISLGQQASHIESTATDKELSAYARFLRQRIKSLAEKFDTKACEVCPFRRIGTK